MSEERAGSAMKTAGKLLLSLAAIAALWTSSPAQAQAPARMLAGFPPGGGVDILARIFAEKWSEAIARPVVVENRAGAGGLIAMEALKSAAPDGNTLLLATDSNLTVYPHTVAKPAYNALGDFIGIAHTGDYAFALGIHAGIPAKSLGEFIAWAKANPKLANFGSSGAGSALQFYGSMIAQATGMPLTHVSYRGVGPAISDLAAGQIVAAVLPMGTVLAQVKAGKARVLAHSGARRTAGAPDVPTFKELGYPTLEAPGWFGIVGPSGMPPETVSRLNQIFVQAMRTAAIKERMARIDLEIREMTPAEFAELIKSDYERWGRVVKASGWVPASN